MDAAGGNKAFGDSAADLLTDLFEAGTLRRLSSYSPIYRMKGMEITSVAYRRAAMQRFGKVNTPRLQALMLDGRPAVILSAEDLTSGLAGYPCTTSVGYMPGTPENPGSAVKIMRNIVLYGIQPEKAREARPIPTVPLSSR
jgi:hypothetical protein